MVSPSATVAEGAQVLRGAIVNADATVGAHALVNSGAIVGHDARDGHGAHVASGARLCGGAVVGAGAHVGAGAVVLEGRRVGPDAVVEAGAVVHRKCPPAGRSWGSRAGLSGTGALGVCQRTKSGCMPSENARCGGRGRRRRDAPLGAAADAAARRFAAGRRPPDVFDAPRRLGRAPVAPIEGA